MSTIRIASDILHDRELRLRRLSLDLIGAVNTNFNAGPVDTAYDERHNLWKESQNEINMGVDGVANVLRDIRTAFDSLDDELAASLTSAQDGRADP
jgi:hypothetical protein